MPTTAGRRDDFSCRIRVDVFGKSESNHGKENVIFWSSKKLEVALASNQIAGWEKVKYLLAPMLFGALFSGPLYIIRPFYGTQMPPFTGNFVILSGIASTYITYHGVKSCFQINSAIDDKLFFERFSVLFLPVCVRMAVVSLLFSFGVLAGLSFLKEQYPSLPQYMDTAVLTYAFGVVVVHFTYVLLCRSFRRFGSLLKENAQEGGEG